MKSFYTSIITFFTLILLGYQSFATHLRAGEITAKRISSTSLTYEITITTYHDEIGGRMASEGQKDVTLCIKPFGTGLGTNVVVPRVESKLLNRSTSRNIYRTSYTFPSPGRFTITCGIENRNDGIVNIKGSVNVAFYLETTLEINAALGLNRTPVLLNPPLDSARVGQKFCHNPAAFDADGDSLAYRLITPRQGKPGTCSGQNVAYIDPALGINPAAKTEKLDGPATLTINALNGDLCWDAPAEPGQYNVAFIIEEWRDGVKIGEIVRDMQIIVVDGPQNKRPLIDPIKDICIEAGQSIQVNIKATDPDNNKLIINVFGGIFNIDNDGTQFNPPIIASEYATSSPKGQIQIQPAAVQINWKTNCNHIRDQPYEVVVKAEDKPTANNVELVSFQTFNIRVVAPKPKTPSIDDVISNNVKSFKLTWSAYQCALAGAQLVVYRKEGCSGAKFDPCQAGSTNALSLGYTEVAKLPISTTTFTDENKGFGFKPGVSYSYRLQVVFALPLGGESVLSDEACFDLPAQMPFLTNVTVDTTSATKGVITVKWSKPQNLKAGDFPAPYQYRLSRATGLNGTTFAQVGTIPTDLLPKTVDTIFVDKNLNTLQNAYRYKLEFYYTENGAFKKLDETEASSSPFLEATISNQVQLSWQANTAWNNSNQKHRVYREDKRKPGTFNIISEVSVQGPNTFTFTDDGKDKYLADGDVSITIKPDTLYCYKIETIGKYDSQRIKTDLLYNFSQITCASPVDNTKPCAPTLKIDTLNCSDLSNVTCSESTFNNLTWTYPTSNASGGACALASSYKVYNGRYPDDKATVIATVQSPSHFFKHTGLSTNAGCYYVTAISRSGVESPASNVVCVDNCPVYRLPNVFSPNNDGKNDTFKPMTCTNTVELVLFSVVNRYGVKVFETTDININWNGQTLDGKEAAAGSYFYQATVTFKRLQKGGSTVMLKGWIELLR